MCSLLQKSTGTGANDNQEKTKPQDDDIDPLQALYVTPVYSFYCVLCDVLLKERNARAEHFKLDTHIEKFNQAEVERKAKEAEKKAEEDAEKAKNGESELKDEVSVENPQEGEQQANEVDEANAAGEEDVGDEEAYDEENEDEAAYEEDQEEADYEEDDAEAEEGDEQTGDTEEQHEGLYSTISLNNNLF